VEESFLKNLKTELGSHFSNTRQARNELCEFIEYCYNTHWMYASLGYRTPQNSIPLYYILTLILSLSSGQKWSITTLHVRRNSRESVTRTS